MEAKTALMTFPVLADTCMGDVLVSDISLKYLNTIPEAKIYKDLFEVLKDETLNDAKQIINALTGAVQQSETDLSFEMKIEDLNMKIFNEKPKTETKE